MNSDNPYAAPQATLSQTEPLALPLAEGVGRNLFPQTSTVELKRLANWNIFIDAMSLLWGVLLCLSLLAFLASLSQPRSLPYGWFWGAAVLLSGLRLWGGYTRARRAWLFNLLMDALFLLLVAWVLPPLARIDLIALALVGGVAFVLMCLAGASVIAHFAARPLYGGYPQRPLNDELRSRQRNRIA